jgi:CRP-like cAMP-binding protein
MSTSIDEAVKPVVQVTNRILLALPGPDYQRLLAKLEFVNLARGTVLYDVGCVIRHVYFLNTGMVSLIATTEDGATVEVGVVGDEGLIGMPAVLGKSRMSYRAIVQIAGTGISLSVAALESELEQCPRLRELLLRYMHLLHSHVSQSAVCNRFHSLEQRLCRWLLTSRDRVGLDRFPLTHESLAHTLGSTRTPLTLTAGALQKAGSIAYHRGLIRILDSAALEASACECYRIVKDNYDHFLDS